MQCNFDVVGLRAKLKSIMYTSDHAFAKGTELTIQAHDFNHSTGDFETLLADDNGNELLLTSDHELELVA